MTEEREGRRREGRRREGSDERRKEETLIKYNNTPIELTTAP